MIPLQGPLAAKRAELSGLAWYGDSLILLPQYPDRFDEQLYVLKAQAIADFLEGRTSEPLRPFPIPMNERDIVPHIPGFDGFESIIFLGNHVYLTVEERRGPDTFGYLVKGEIAEDLSEIRLDPAYITQILPQAKLKNMSDETSVVVGDQVMTFYEANGRIINPSPVVHLFNSETINQIGTLPLDHIEYRITDASEADAEGRFWVINYFFPGDRALRPILRSRGAAGLIDENAAPIERLLQLQVTVKGVVRTATPPIDLELLPDNVARNWEGLVQLETATLHGFLLVTDSFPETIFAFVPNPY
ncbi:MAG: hypothetical protein R3C14_22840 [Caldilineaceae bacterium]